VGSWAPPLELRGGLPPSSSPPTRPRRRWAMGKGGWSAPAASLAGLSDPRRRPLEGRRRSGGGRHSLVLQDAPSAAWAARWWRMWDVRGSPDLRPDLKMAAPSRAARHTPSALECLVLSGGWWVVLVME
jgi:hypothetical protein